MAPSNFTLLLLVAFLLRMAMIVFAHFMDSHSHMKYTDIDYEIFTDAALHVY